MFFFLPGPVPVQGNVFSRIIKSWCHLISITGVLIFGGMVFLMKKGPRSWASVTLSYQVICGLFCQKLVSREGTSNYIPQWTSGCNYSFLPEIPASGNKVLIFLFSDIDECAAGGVGWSGCKQVCNNTVGSYTCSCEEGFTLETDGACTPCELLVM